MKQIHILSLGAGVQSSTLALMAARGEIGPMPDAAIFADTGNEPKAVYRWLDYLASILPYPVYRVGRAESLSVESLRLRERRDGSGSYIRQSIPAWVWNKKTQKESLLTRGCTRDFKIRPIVTHSRRLKRAAKAQQIVSYIGISTDEAHRMKPAREHDILTRWPLIEQELSRQDCLDWMQRQGYPQPPRSACIFCPYHSDAEWVRLRDEDPNEFRAAVRFERALQRQLTKATKPTTTHKIIYLHRSCQPLDQVEFKEGPDGFGNECAGVCRT